MDEDKQGLPSEELDNSTSASAPDKAPEQLEKKPAPAASVADNATLKRIEAAERRAAQAEEYARTVQQSKDRENAQVRKEAKERLAKERAALVSLLKDTGVDEGRLAAFQQQRSQEDETDDLRYKATAYDNLTIQEQARQARDQHVAAQCAEFGVDPSDQRLDLSSPEKFALSLAKVVKADAAKAAPVGKKEEPPAKNGEGSAARRARQDLDVLGGGGSAKTSGDEEFQKKLKELRGTGRLADAMALIREREGKS